MHKIASFQAVAKLSVLPAEPMARPQDRMLPAEDRGSQFAQRGPPKDMAGGRGLQEGLYSA